VFVRKKQNESGSVSVQLISKENGYYQVVETLGSSSDKDEIERLVLKGKSIIRAGPPGQPWLFSIKTEQDLIVENCFTNLSNQQIRTIGPELIFGALFDRIGFNAVQEELFRHLVITRLVYPTSKLKTIDYLERYQGVTLSASAIYRFLDRLADRYKDQVAEVAYQHTKKHLITISVVFYDLTTLYFEASDEDDLRKIGFSKDGKFQKPQILLGLLVGEQGWPIGYDIFEGNTFEGHTLMPMLHKIQERYGIQHPIVVADAALLSKENIRLLEKQHYQFIIGGRIKNENENIKTTILSKAAGIKNGEGFAINKPDGTRLIVTYSDKRAKKDAHQRAKGLKKLKGRIQSGMLTKQSLHNRGYNRFLTIQGHATIVIDEEKVKQDQYWDGLKGYVTNTSLPIENIVDHYLHLWQIERAFRVSKTDLKVRPTHHYLKRRIEAHVCIAFVAYSIYKELECLLKQKGLDMSPKRAAELTKNMYQIHYTLPDSGEQKQQLLKMDSEQRLLDDAVHK